MIQEQYPDQAELRSEWALRRNQGTVLSCSAQGTAAPISTIFHRLGLNINLAARHIWWNLRGKEISIDSAAQVLRDEGCCIEELCPYDVNMLGVPPSYEALQDAKSRSLKNLRAVQIDGVEGVKRAISRGSPITFKMVNGDSSEHISCIDGYGPDGLYVWDSNGVQPDLIFPWSDVESGGRIVQMRRWEGLQLVPAKGYIEGDTPSLVDGVLNLPKLRLWIGFDKEPKSIQGENVKFEIIDRGWVSYDNEDVRDLVFWHSQQRTLYLPKLIIDGVLRYGVKMVGPVATFISGQEV